MDQNYFPFPVASDEFVRQSDQSALGGHDQIGGNCVRDDDSIFKLTKEQERKIKKKRSYT